MFTKIRKKRMWKDIMMEEIMVIKEEITKMNKDIIVKKEMVTAVKDVEMEMDVGMEMGVEMEEVVGIVEEVVEID